MPLMLAEVNLSDFEQEAPRSPQPVASVKMEDCNCAFR
jgi:hypothetical protein